MSALSPIAASLAAVQQAIGLVKQLLLVGKSVESADWKLKLAELSEVLADTKMSLADAQEEILNLRDRLKTAEEKKDSRDQVKLSGNVYIPKGENAVGGPWCTKCLDVDGNLIVLHHSRGRSGSHDGHSWVEYLWSCPACKSKVKADERGRANMG